MEFFKAQGGLGLVRADEYLAFDAVFEMVGKFAESISGDLRGAVDAQEFEGHTRFLPVYNFSEPGESLDAPAFGLGVAVAEGSGFEDFESISELGPAGRFSAGLAAAGAVARIDFGSPNTMR